MAFRFEQGDSVLQLITIDNPTHWQCYSFSYSFSLFALIWFLLFARPLSFRCLFAFLKRTCQNVGLLANTGASVAAGGLSG